MYSVPSVYVKQDLYLAFFILRIYCSALAKGKRKFNKMKHDYQMKCTD
jgi:hypothetical protein